MRPSRSTTRPAVTLLELLVVIGIMLALTALAAAILPALRQKNNSAKAAAQVQGFLSISKQQAVRDRAPRGLRLILDPLDPNLVRSLQYVEVPDPTRFENPYGATVTATPSLVISQNVVGDTDNYEVLVINTSSTWGSVGAELGDYFVITKGSSTYFFEIRQFKADPNGQRAVLKGRSGLQGLFPDPPPPPPPPALPPPPPLKVTTATEFMIVRRARPLVGEQAIQLPPNMSIDLRYSAVSKPQLLPPAPGTPVKYDRLAVPICLNSGYEGGVAQLDILFGADGELLGTVTDKVILCVKPDDGKAGEATLVVIYSRTGGIMLQPTGVDPLPDASTMTVPSPTFDNLFFFTQDGAGSGL